MKNEKSINNSIYLPDLTHLEDAQYLIFDLDNTLYSHELGLIRQVESRMTNFIADTLDVDDEKAAEIRSHYYHTYGTTLKGLMDLHQIDPDYFLDYVHDIDSSIVKENPILNELLHALDKQKLIFTNGSKKHAENILSQLGVNGHFNDIFDIVAADFIPKPHMPTYVKLCQEYQLTPEKCIFFDDLVKNLIPAAEIGMTTVLLTTECGHAMKGAGDAPIDYQVSEVTDFLRHYHKVFK